MPGTFDVGEVAVVFDPGAVLGGFDDDVGVGVDDLRAQVALKAIHHREHEDDDGDADGDHEGGEGAEDGEKGIKCAEEADAEAERGDGAAGGHEVAGEAGAVAEDGEFNAGAGLQPDADAEQERADAEQAEAGDEHLRSPVAAQQVAPADEALVASGQAAQVSGRSSGKKITSRIEGLSVMSMTSRSMPMPWPAAGGMPYSRART